MGDRRVSEASMNAFTSDLRDNMRRAAFHSIVGGYQTAGNVGLEVEGRYTIPVRWLEYKGATLTGRWDRTRLGGLRATRAFNLATRRRCSRK
jgi:hypothetical protein